MKRRRLSLARLGRAPSRRVDAVDLIHSAPGVGFESTRWWGLNHKFQPGHRGRATGGCGRALRCRGVGDFAGKVDAIVGGRGVEVECWRLRVGEVVLTRDDQVAGKEVALVVWGREGEGGGGQAGEDCGVFGGNTGGVV